MKRANFPSSSAESVDQILARSDSGEKLKGADKQALRNYLQGSKGGRGDSEYRPEVSERIAKIREALNLRDFANNLESSEYHCWEPSPENLLPLENLHVGDVLMLVCTDFDQIDQGIGNKRRDELNVRREISFAIITGQANKDSMYIHLPDTAFNGKWFDEFGGSGGGIGLDDNGQLGSAYSQGYKLSSAGKEELKVRFPDRQIR